MFEVLRAGYDPLVDAISELGEEGAPNALAWNVLGFGVTALLHALLALALWPHLSSDVKGRLAAELLALASLALAASGAFRCDAGCPQVPATLPGALHNVAGQAYFATLKALPFVAGRAFGARPAWRALARPTLYPGGVLVVLFVAGPIRGTGRIGAWQRGFLLPSHVWLAGLALRLFSLYRSRQRTYVGAANSPGH